MPLVSVITPCFNAAQHIGAAMDSVFGQTLEALELIVVDDGSTDASAERVGERAVREPRLRLIRQANAGAGPARNRGLREARGQYVAFLDADDYWAPECLAALHAALAASGADLAYCGWQNVGLPGGRGEPFVPPDYAGADLVERFLGGCRWPIHAVLTRRACIEAVSGFDERWSSCMDYDLWLRLAARVKVVRVPEVLAYYRHHGTGQITGDRLRVARNHLAIQRCFLQTHPQHARRLGRARVRELIYGELRQRAFTAYWQRDLTTARALFGDCLRTGYFGARDLKYMLPSLLPAAVHRRLVAWSDGPAPAAPR